jgi:methylmalonyl-CoA/ethylmalonyl-CoA epimerase
MVIDHICFAVKNLDEGILFWKDVFGYVQYTKPVINSRQKVKVVFLKKDSSVTIKIIEPTEANTALINVVSQGDRFHHICFKCDDVQQGVASLRAKGLKVLVPPQPGEAFDNNLIAFLLAGKNINIELIDTDTRSEIVHP